ncbi:unannotated protein [freshwater metagenome]|uniref:Unannotated protein n=1 Tax=freshwater metagenome TaxID=449393 RepID=A0A6J6G796_9ZZZZ
MASASLEKRPMSSLVAIVASAAVTTGSTPAAASAGSRLFAAAASNAGLDSRITPTTASSVKNPAWSRPSTSAVAARSRLIALGFTYSGFAS